MIIIKGGYIVIGISKYIYRLPGLSSIGRAYESSLLVIIRYALLMTLLSDTLLDDDIHTLLYYLHIYYEYMFR